MELVDFGIYWKQKEKWIFLLILLPIVQMRLWNKNKLLVAPS